ncbi:MAG: hypothetical protein K2M71_10645 [Duncaniella sp.]|nr:hypothetical protein [Duncaniella sp.]
MITTHSIMMVTYTSVIFFIAMNPKPRGGDAIMPPRNIHDGKPKPRSGDAIMPPKNIHGGEPKPRSGDTIIAPPRGDAGKW